MGISGKLGVLVLAILFLGLMSQQLMAQTITVRGEIFATDGRTPLEGAGVYHKASGKGAYSGPEGRFELKIPQPTDTLFLRISYIGYETRTLTVPRIARKLQNGLYVFPNKVELREEGAMTEDVIISAAKMEQKTEELTVSVSTLDTRDLDNQASSTLTRSLEQTPGLTVFSEQISIRGSNGYAQGTGSRVLVMLDGMPLMSGEGGDPRFDMIPTDNIQSVEVIKGAASVLYGAGAMGGVVNVISKEPTEEPRTVLRMRGELYDRPANDSADWDGSSAAYAASLHAVHARKINNLDLTATLDLMRNSSYRQGESTYGVRARLNTKYHVKRRPGLTLGLNTLVALDSSGFFIGWEGYPDGALQPNVDLVTGESDLLRQRRIYYVIDPEISYLTPRGHRHWYRGRAFITIMQPEDPTKAAQAYQYHNEYQYIHRLTSDVTVIAGAAYDRTNVSSDSIYGDRHQQSLAGFLQVEAELFNRLNLSGGMRYQWDEVEDTVVINRPIFRLGANMRIRKATFLRASWGQALRNPSIRERYIETVQGAFNALPNPDLEVESGFTAEVGLKQLFRVGSLQGAFDVAGFHQNFDNMIEFTLVSDPETGGIAGVRNINLADAQITGYEVGGSVQGDFGNLKWLFNGSYTYINPIDENGVDSLDGNDNPLVAPITQPDRPRTLKYRSKHMLRFSTALNYNGNSLTVNCRYNSEIINVDNIFFLNYDGAQQFRRDNNNGWTIFDIIVARDIGEKSKVSFHVFNLLNEEYMTIPGTLGPQRSFALQYKQSF